VSVSARPAPRSSCLRKQDSRCRWPWIPTFAGMTMVVGLMPAVAWAQSVAIDLGTAGQAGATGRPVQITALITVLSIAPSLLVMLTAFTRIVVVLSLLRSAIATQSTPPNMVLIGLALFLTYFVMQPVLDQAWRTGLLPLTQGHVDEMEGLRLTAEPIRHFMLPNLRGG
jgi:flagellar biosynthesis protein FliP